MRTRTIFEFIGADNAGAVASERANMADAQARWPFLTPFDASTIKNERQLATMLKEQCSLPPPDANKEVREWVTGRVFQAMPNRLATPEGTPLFFNELGVRSIDVGTAAFHCMGAMPPDDHPHVYLNMGEELDILCPYCSTEYRFNAALAWNETIPANCSASEVPRVRER